MKQRCKEAIEESILYSPTEFLAATHAIDH
jgi:hypothetical protein